MVAKWENSAPKLLPGATVAVFVTVLPQGSVAVLLEGGDGISNVVPPGRGGKLEAT